MSSTDTLADMALFNITRDDSRVLTSEISDQKIVNAVASLYDDFIKQHPSLVRIFERNKTDIDGHKKALAEYWKHLIREFDREEFRKDAIRVGVIHQKIGVEPIYYSAAYSYVLRQLIRDLISSGGFFSSGQNRRDAVCKLISLSFYDLSTVLESYVQASIEETTRKTKEMMLLELSKDAVNASISLNEMFINIVKNHKQSNEVSMNVETISSAMEELVSSIRQISDNSGKASEIATESLHLTSQGVDTVQRVEESINQIEGRVVETDHTLALLVNSAEQIEEFATIVENIASQTGLLALNATIEAARAGEAGKGFAVVASEVKSLSENTSKASGEIRERIETLRESVSKITNNLKDIQASVGTGSTIAQSAKDVMGAIREKSEMVGGRMNTISDILQEQTAASDEIARTLDGIHNLASDNASLSRSSEDSIRASSQLFDAQLQRLASASTTGDIIISIAKADHIAWKRKLADALTGGNFDPSDIKDHTQCRLGKWYATTGKERFGHMKEFTALEDPHRRVHANGLRAIEFLQKHQIDKAFEAYADLEKGSVEVLDLLDKMLARVLEQQ